MELVEKLKKLNLPVNSFAIFGSGQLCIRNLIPWRDIDIIAKKDLWDELSKKYGDKGHKIEIGDIEIFYDWPGFDNIDKLIDTADFIEGLPFVNIENVLKWKKERNHLKDAKHIMLLENIKKII
ncbi:hypothetical protein C0585_04155 [Candidatus Woesearchaeota archaeon]|nr:MAG: hypothetical protein C0585_04155 [Candidatus Woesearchaeota archaeon]